jgi:hypothetical protein
VTQGKIALQTTRIDRRGAIINTENIGRRGKERSEAILDENFGEATGDPALEIPQLELSAQHELGIDNRQFAIASSLPGCSTAQLWELSESVNTLLRLQS